MTCASAWSRGQCGWRLVKPPLSCTVQNLCSHNGPWWFCHVLWWHQLEMCRYTLGAQMSLELCAFGELVYLLNTRNIPVSEERCYICHALLISSTDCLPVNRTTVERKYVFKIITLILGRQYSLRTSESGLYLNPGSTFVTKGRGFYFPCFSFLICKIRIIIHLLHTESDIK